MMQLTPASSMTASFLSGHSADERHVRETRPNNYIHTMPDKRDANHRNNEEGCVESAAGPDSLIWHPPKLRGGPIDSEFTNVEFSPVLQAIHLIDAEEAVGHGCGYTVTTLSR